MLKLPNWQRIKGIVHTSDGWLKINFTPDSLTITTTSAQIDSRLEIILQSVIDKDDSVVSDKAEVENTPPLLSSLDWETCDHELMALVIEDTP